jgi:hypothetical protein
MRLPTCVGCGAVVLEVAGQFEVLDSFYLEENTPPEESSGDWHTSCLRESPYGLAWHDARLKNHVVVRGYLNIATAEEWTIIKHPRTAETLALSRAGEFLSLTYPAGLLRRATGGSIYRVVEKEYNLHLEGYAGVAPAIQEALTSMNTFPVLSLFEMLGIRDRVLHPEALADGMIHYGRALSREWSSTFVSASWEYGVFVPAELELYVVGKAQHA